jgi:hypothetical protein
MLSSLIVESRRLWIKFRNYVFALMDNDTRFWLARNIKIRNLTMMQKIIQEGKELSLPK